MAHDIAGAVAASAFWIFIAVCVVAAMASAAFRHRETQKTIRQAIEKGETLDPATLNRLLQSDPLYKGPPPRGPLIFGGIMLLAIAGGLVLISWSMSMTNPSQLYPGLGAAGMVGLLGAGLLVAARVLRDPRGNGRE